MLWQDNDGAEKYVKMVSGHVHASRDIFLSSIFGWPTAFTQGKIDVRHCNTVKMLADFYTNRCNGSCIILGLPVLRNHFQVFDTTKLLFYNNNITYLLQTPILKK